MSRFVFFALILSLLLIPLSNTGQGLTTVQYMRDSASLAFANALLKEALNPVNYDNFLEFQQFILKSGGERTKIQPFEYLGQTVHATGNDPLTFYIDTVENENLLDKVGSFVYGWEIILPGFGGGEPPPPLPDSMILPVPGGVVTQWYGCQQSIKYSVQCPGAPPSWLHNGIDFDAPGTGEPIVAAAQGTVLAIGENPGCGYGNWVILHHPDIQRYSEYSHLSKIDVKVGDSVTQGQQIGNIGSTGFAQGEHLHFILFASQPTISNNCFVGQSIDPFGYLKE